MIESLAARERNRWRRVARGETIEDAIVGDLAVTTAAGVSSQEAS